MPQQTTNSPSPPPALPPRPQYRPAPSRAGSICFWTLFLLFLAGIGYVGMLAYTRNAGQAQPAPGTGGHLTFELLLVGFAIVAVIAVIASHHHGKQHHH